MDWIAAAPWNSLEVVKLLVGVATPLALAAIGIFTFRLTNQIEQRQWTNQKIVEKRLAIYEKVAPQLNDLYCFFRWRGNWKELTPEAMIATKRCLDKEFYVNEFLFSYEFKHHYNEFIHRCFKTYGGYNKNAKLRTSIKSGWGDRRTATIGGWKPEWEDLFVPDCRGTDASKCEQSDERDIERSYKVLMYCFAAELGIGFERSRH